MTNVPTSWPEYVYLTRDCDEETGELSETVEVWREPPELYVSDIGSLWISCHTDEMLLGRYPVSALTRLRTLPETGRECVRLPVK